MTAGSILDADMATVSQWARRGFAWWTEELAGMVPASIKHGLAGRPPVEARFDGHGLTLSRRGAAISRADGAVVLLMPAEMALVRTVSLPALGAGDLRRLLAIEADRLLPFAAGTALVDHQAGATGPDGRQSVTIAGLPLVAARAVMAAAEAQGLDVRQLRLADGAGGARFDFLPGWNQGAVSAATGPRRFWWGAVVAALVINLVVLIARDIINLRETEALVASHGEAAATARQLRTRVTTEDASRRALLARRHAQDPLPILASLTRALPDSAWVQRLAWDGTQLRMAGYKPGTFDIIASLRRLPIFADVRSTQADVPAQVGTGQPFEIAAALRK